MAEWSVADALFAGDVVAWLNVGTNTCISWTGTSASVTPTIIDTDGRLHPWAATYYGTPVIIHKADGATGPIHVFDKVYFQLMDLPHFFPGQCMFSVCTLEGSAHDRDRENLQVGSWEDKQCRGSFGGAGTIRMTTFTISPENGSTAA